MEFYFADPKIARPVPYTSNQISDKDIESLCDVAMDDAYETASKIEGFVCTATHETIAASVLTTEGSQFGMTRRVRPVEWD